MAGQLLDDHSQLEMVRHGAFEDMDNLFGSPLEYKSKWYLSRKELENNSPSRKDGIDLRKENQLRMLYCSFLQDVGMKLGVPQVTIATAMMFCHRFYLCQSHAKNGWPTVATACIFLASKVEETPRSLDKVVIVAYEMVCRGDPAAAQRIRSKEIFEKQKELILIGERLLLSTVAFDLNIQHPYKPLVAALKKLRIVQNDVLKVAWNFVNDWLRTTLCLQYKPHYIAAGSLYLTAKLKNVKLPSDGGLIWWHEFDVTPRQLEEVIQQMMEFLGFKRRVIAPCARQKAILTPVAAKEEASSSPESCVLSTPGSSSSPSLDFGGEAGGDRPIKSVDLKISHSWIPAHGNAPLCEKIESQSQAQDSESPNGIIEDGGRHANGKDQTRMEPTQVLKIEPTQVLKMDVSISEGLVKIDKDRIRAALKRRKWGREIIKAAVIDDTSEDAWIESELETGLDMGDEPSEKKQRL